MAPFTLTSQYGSINLVEFFPQWHYANKPGSARPRMVHTHVQRAHQFRDLRRPLPRTLWRLSDSPVTTVRDCLPDSPSPTIKSHHITYSFIRTEWISLVTSMNFVSISPPTWIHQIRRDMGIPVTDADFGDKSQRRDATADCSAPWWMFFRCSLIIFTVSHIRLF